jgi:hypothetical protein
MITLLYALAAPLFVILGFVSFSIFAPGLHPLFSDSNLPAWLHSTALWGSTAGAGVLGSMLLGKMLVRRGRFSPSVWGHVTRTALLYIVTAPSASLVLRNWEDAELWTFGLPFVITSAALSGAILGDILFTLREVYRHSHHRGVATP